MTIQGPQNVGAYDPILVLADAAKPRFFPEEEMPHLLERTSEVYDKAAEAVKKYGNPNSRMTAEVEYRDRHENLSYLHFHEMVPGVILINVRIGEVDEGAMDCFHLYTLRSDSLIRDIQGNACGSAEINQTKWLVGAMADELKKSAPSV